MRRPQLVASDVDGTLVDPLNRVSARTAATVARVTATGTAFVLVSGRPPRWIPEVAAAVGVRGYAVCANGAVLYDLDAGRVVRSRHLRPTLLSDIVHTLNGAIPGMTIATERVIHSAQPRDRQEFLTEEGYRHPWPETSPGVASRAEVLAHPAVKLLVRHEGMASEDIAMVAQSLLADAVHVTFSTGFGMIEISAAGVTKGTGLAEVAELLGVEAADCVAFGDMPNDLPMLRWAGHAVAVANAHPEVIAVADETTAANSADGVAAVLERWF